MDVKLPELGDGIASADVLEILVKVGDSVTKDQGLVEMETDKATVTVPSPGAGKVVAISVTEGQTVAIGAVILQLEAMVGAPAAASKSSPAPTKSPAVAASPAKPLVADKPAPQAPVHRVAPAALTPAQLPPTPIPPAPSVPVTTAAVPIVTESSELIPAGPAVRRFAREVGIDLGSVTGTGEGGRITRDDVLLAVREGASQRANFGGAATVTPSNAVVAAPMGGNRPLAMPGAPGHDNYGPIRTEKLSKIRKTIAAQMHKSWSTVPRVTNFDDADVTDLEAFRASSKDDYAAQGIKLTTMPFLIKAVATALRHHPAINSQIDVENEQIIFKDYVNVGIAIDSKDGLIVPNLRNADRMSIPEIARALGEMAARVRNGEFGVNELRGGTFTISNLGAIGGTYSTPIVNVPEVAILLVGRTRKLPVVMDDDSIKPRLMMPLSLSYDHRSVDGAAAARFLNDVIAYLEAPSRLLLAIA